MIVFTSRIIAVITATKKVEWSLLTHELSLDRCEASVYLWPEATRTSVEAESQMMDE
jgi:hypothetical protein